jgi:hypothetical protein
MGKRSQHWPSSALLDTSCASMDFAVCGDPGVTRKTVPLRPKNLTLDFCVVLHLRTTSTISSQDIPSRVPYDLQRFRCPVAAPGGSPQPEGGHRNGGNLHEQYVALESGSDDENEYQTAGRTSHCPSPSEPALAVPKNGCGL